MKFCCPKEDGIKSNQIDTVYFQLSKAESSVSSKCCPSGLRRFIAIFQESQNLTFIKWKISGTGMERKM